MEQNKQSGKNRSASPKGLLKQILSWFTTRTTITTLTLLLFFFGPLFFSVGTQVFSDDANIGIEAAKIVYGWPVVVAVCLMGSLLLFHNPIQQLLERLSGFKINRSGVEVKAQVQPQQISNSEKELAKKGSLDPTSQINTALEKLESNEADAIRKIVIDFHNGWRAEKIWNVIYGSQIYAVKSLVNSPDKKIKLDDFRPLFARHLEKFSVAVPEQSDDLDIPEIRNARWYAWLDFLENSSLIERDAEYLVATEFGSIFISYLKNQGYTENSRIF